MENELAISNQEKALATSEMKAFMNQAMVLMQGMADMVRATNERMAALETQVRMLEKVTPAQAADLNRAIRERAADICEEYRMKGQDKPVAAAIRKSVRLSTGAHSTREIARCEYTAVREMVETWDDYKAIKGIKTKGARG